MQNQNPSGHESDEKTKQSLFDWVKNHKITVTLFAVFYFSLNVIMNYFGNNPRMLFFPAVVACIAFCWIVLSGTHKFVTSQLNETTPTNLVEMDKNLPPENQPTTGLTTNISPIVDGSITTPRPLAIMREIKSARPMQQDAIAKSFIRAKVRWLLNLNSIEHSGDKPLIVFLEQKQPGVDYDVAVVLCRGVSDEDKNLLRLAEKGSQFYVSGTISDCSSTGITLSDCRLESYSENTPMK
jgi:hypothetical protein